CNEIDWDLRIRDERCSCCHQNKGGPILKFSAENNVLLDMRHPSTLSDPQILIIESSPCHSRCPQRSYCIGRNHDFFGHSNGQGYLY
ncbi:hypothetical protein L218DRAFT_1050263, partial [Marasmius fiardii PR-910]